MACGAVTCSVHCTPVTMTALLHTSSVVKFQAPMGRCFCRIAPLRHVPAWSNASNFDSSEPLPSIGGRLVELYVLKAWLNEHGFQLGKGCYGASHGYYNGITNPGGHEHYVHPSDSQVHFCSEGSKKPLQLVSRKCIK